MSPKILLFLALFLTCSLVQAQEEFQLRYIEKYSGIAVREMERAGIPASIKLAQGILESNSGRSDLAKRANNHFGIKCGGSWTGKKVYKEDDDYDDRGNLIESCFRAYRNAEASFVAHSEFLRDPKKAERYGFLFRLDPTDYRRWATGLKRAGYATSATYHTKLINLIERLELHKFDKAGPVGELIVDREFSPGGYLTVNDVQYVIAEEDETVTAIARRTDTTLKRLVKYNEDLKDGAQRLAEGQKVFVQPKRNAYLGKKTWHYVKKGETMVDISQHYGIKLEKLYSRNRMSKGQEPAVNEQIKIRGSKVSARPRLNTEEKEEEEPNRPELIFEDDEEPAVEIPEKETEFSPPPIPSPAPLINIDEFITPSEEVEMEEDFLEEEMFGEEPESPPTNIKQPELEPIVPREEPPTAPTRPIVTPTTEPTPEPAPTIEEESIFDEGITPVSEPTRTPPPAPTTPAADDSGDGYHTVETGDTLWNISQRYRTTVENIVNLNNLKNYNIRVGQRLKIK